MTFGFRPSFLFIALLLTGFQSTAAAQERMPWKMDASYTGSHPKAFNELKWKIPSLVRQTQVDMAVRLGLDFEEGWRYPLTIRFTDESPSRVENILAYVRLAEQNGILSQDLVINVAAYASTGFDFERVFAHELVHAMINDALGAEGMTVFPVWLNEGLAVFGAGQGDRLVQSYVHQFWGFAESRLIDGLDGPHSGLDYVEDYLAIKYIRDEHSANALRLFVRELTRRRGGIQKSYESAVNEPWEEFLENAKAYAIRQIRSVEPPQRGKIDQPF